MSAPFDKPIVSPILAGRGPELETLKHALTNAQQGTGQCFILVGEAGIGKSRMLAELRGYGQTKGFLVLQGDCFESDLTFPYAPLIDGLRLFFASRSPGEVAEMLDPLAPELVKLLPELALNLPGLQPTPTLDPESEKRRLFESLAQFFTRLSVSHPAETQPLLLIVEDLHWSDESSLEFLYFFARRLAAFPILLLLSYRREEMAPYLRRILAQFHRRRLAQEIGLDQLSRDDTDLMLRAIFGLKRPVRAEFLQAIYNLTDGNPFYIEEVLKSLIAAGDIFYARGYWDRKPIDELHIPATVLAAVQQRTATLSEGSQQLLTLAAVAGRRFDYRLLQLLTGYNEAELLAQIKALMAAQLVVEETADRFAFRHALTRQAIYSNLLARERRTLHLKIAETLERLHPDVETHLPALAYHFYQAEAWDKALPYAQRAGERALAQHALHAALEQFNRAITARQHLDALPLPPLHQARGQVHEWLGDFDAAESDYSVALAAALEVGDRQAEWQSLLALGFLWSGKDYEKSGSYLQDSLDLARELEDPATLAHSLNRIGNWYANMEQVKVAHGYHEEALMIFQELGDPSGLATTLDLLGTTAYLAGDMPAGISYYEQAIPYFRQAGDEPGLISCLGSYTARGANPFAMVAPPIPLAESERDASEGIRLAQKIGWRAGEAFVRIMWGLRLATVGEYTRALYQASTAWQLATDVESIGWQAFAQTLFGVIYADILDFPAARDYLEKGLHLARTLGAPELHHTIVGFLAPVYVSSGYLDKAESLLADHAPASDRSFTSESQLFAWFANADLALANKKFQDVLDLVENGLKSMPHVAEGGIVPRLWWLRGEALLDLNRVSEAIELLQEAQVTAEVLGARPFLWRNLISLGNAHLAARRREEAAAAFDQARQIVETLVADLDEPALRAPFQSQAVAAIPKLPPQTPLQKEKARYGGLTRREREVAALVAGGMSNLEIAEKLFIGERTVETHVSHILTKLNFDNRTQIAAWAIEVDLVSNEQ
jgi:DNA-binding CsgD family transcriptional regulator